jgi:glycerol-3-phosphate dehydrogenase
MTQFPQLESDEGDVLATYAGVRPVIDSGAADPSREGRDHALWLENGPADRYRRQADHLPRRSRSMR